MASENEKLAIVENSLGSLDTIYPYYKVNGAPELKDTDVFPIFRWNSSEDDFLNEINILIDEIPLQVVEKSLEFLKISFIRRVLFLMHAFEVFLSISASVGGIIRQQ